MDSSRPEVKDSSRCFIEMLQFFKIVFVDRLSNKFLSRNNKKQFNMSAFKFNIMFNVLGQINLQYNEKIIVGRYTCLSNGTSRQRLVNSF